MAKEYLPNKRDFLKVVESEYNVIKVELQNKLYDSSNEDRDSGKIKKKIEELVKNEGYVIINTYWNVPVIKLDVWKKRQEIERKLDSNHKKLQALKNKIVLEGMTLEIVKSANNLFERI